MSLWHRSFAANVFLLPAAVGACSIPPPVAPVAARAPAALAVPPRPLLVAAPDALRLRLVEQPDPGTTGVVIPDVVELPSGDLVVAGTSWATNLGPGAEHIADGFVAGFGPDGVRRWLCLSAGPPAGLGVDGAGGVYVALTEPGVAACAPGAGIARAEGRWGAPAGPIFSNIEVAVDAAGRPRWSTPSRLRTFP